MFIVHALTVADVRVESRNIVRAGLLGPDAVRWTDRLPADVQSALQAAEDEGVAVDLTGDPVFYETEVDFLRCSRSIGSAAAEVIAEITKTLKATDLGGDERRIIINAVRTSAYSGNYHEGLAALMRWVAVSTADDED